MRLAASARVVAPAAQWADETDDDRCQAVGVAVPRAIFLNPLPVTMDVQRDGFPALPTEADAAKINSAMTTLSKPFGTTLRTNGWYTEAAIAT